MFKKVFLTYLSILILIMAALSFTISSLAESYVYDEKKKVLENVALRAGGAANSFISGDIDSAGLSRIIDSMAYITDTKIYIVKSDIDLETGAGGMLTGEYLNEALEKVLAGEEVFLRRQYSEGFEARMLFLGSPWKNGDEIKGAVLLFSPEKEIASIIGSTQLAIWLIAAASVLLGGIVIYLFSGRIVRPIKAIDAASVKMAEGGHVDDIAITSHDELAGMARSFNSMKRKLEKNEALRQDLIANISHDLRTPLTNINGFLSGMSEGVIKQEDYPRYIAILKKETKRLMDLTGGILEAAKVQSGSIELNISRFDIRKALESAAAANHELARCRNIAIDIAAKEKLFVSADQSKIIQALFNLVNNAVKYSHEGGAVTVSARRSDKGTEVCIEDRGEGIDEKDLPNIFEKFYRAPSGSGYGLGLYIAKTHIEAHGSRLIIESRKGNGTKASFTLI